MILPSLPLLAIEAIVLSPSGLRCGQRVLMIHLLWLDGEEVWGKRIKKAVTAHEL